jgi:undecaprenyl-diphosphatase
VSILQIIVLSIIQGLCELLPVSSSAHVLVGARLMGIDPSSPEMTFLLVMLHTGTMFAVIAYFWNSWRRDYFGSRAAVLITAKELVVASVATTGIGGILLVLIEKVILYGQPKAEVEALFSNFTLIGFALAAVGLLILAAGKGRRGDENVQGTSHTPYRFGTWRSLCIGAVQGLCLPFRGFSRSGATISTGLIMGATRLDSEKFSFALAVILTPPVILRELLRLIKAHTGTGESMNLSSLTLPGIIGMICSFAAGLLALRWLSRWLEQGRWQWFGFYCLAAAIAVFLISRHF